MRATARYELRSDDHPQVRVIESETRRAYCGVHDAEFPRVEVQLGAEATVVGRLMDVERWVSALVAGVDRCRAEVSAAEEAADIAAQELRRLADAG